MTQHGSDQHHSIFGSPDRERTGRPAFFRMSSPETAMATETMNVQEQACGGNSVMLPWSLIPAFVPGITDVEQYSRTVQIPLQNVACDTQGIIFNDSASQKGEFCSRSRDGQ